MLLSAGCCIPAVLLLLSMWIKILENNRKGKDTSPERPETSGVADNDDLPSSATNDVDTEETTAERRHRAIIGAISRYGEVLMLGAAAAAVLALLIAGERNLFSHQLRYQTEPIANIGTYPTRCIIARGLTIVARCRSMGAYRWHRLCSLWFPLRSTCRSHERGTRDHGTRE